MVPAICCQTMTMILVLASTRMMNARRNSSRRFVPWIVTPSTGSGAIIPDITDRELNAILKQISYAKGNRITFILDCCHAGSVTRTLSPGVRTVPPLERVSLKDMLFTAGEALRGLPGDRSMFAEDWVADTDSHVIVAACRENEVAKAQRVKGTKVWGGVFTNLLINTLRSGVLGVGATYEDLIRALPPLRFQTQSWQEGREYASLVSGLRWITTSGKLGSNL